MCVLVSGSRWRLICDNCRLETIVHLVRRKGRWLSARSLAGWVDIPQGGDYCPRCTSVPVGVHS